MSEPTLGDLLDRYFDLGVAEGREGRDHDTLDGAAQETRQKIAGAIARAREEAAKDALEDSPGNLLGGSEPLEWPARLTLRDTKVYADEGQRIYTTATGHGYERHEYVRADISKTLLESLHDILTRPTDAAARQRCRAAIAKAEGD